ncbi:MAG: hypothetical protein ACRDTC_23550 [Pseudonocardiaceae bacterium]
MRPEADRAPTTRSLITDSRTRTDTTTPRLTLGYWRQRLSGAVLVHGDARGADRITAGIRRPWGPPTQAHPTDWTHHGRSAGHRRNRVMVALGTEVCLTSIRHHSPGATGCATLAHAAGIPTPRISPPPEPRRHTA